MNTQTMPDSTTELAHSLNRDGFSVVREVISAGMLSDLRNLCAQSPEHLQVRRNGETYGVRHLLGAIPALREIVAAPPFIGLARAVLGDAAHPVKGVFFDKTPAANWPVPWHQDVTITVQDSRDVSGFEMRPVKDGFVHAVPPVEFSENLLALRIHLDDATGDHGALRVIPGSHLSGRIPPAEIHHWVAKSNEYVITVGAGDVMLMRPLLLHASSACRTPGHRRVIHVEYSASDLPGGLQWAG